MIDLAAQRSRRIRIIAAVYFAAAIGLAASSAVKGAAGIVVMVVTGLIASVAGVYFSRLIRSWMPAAWSVYFVLIIVGGVVKGTQHPPRPWTMWIFAGATIAAAAGGMLLVVRAVRGTRELDRVISVESITIAFFTTMIASLTYALLEVWVHAPKVSMWVPWSFGMFTWAAATIVFQRRYS